MKIETFEDLFVSELRDMYSAERQLLEALPEMARAARDKALAQAFETHLQETETQVARIEKAMDMLGIIAREEKCEAMKGLIEEARQMMSSIKSGAVLDVALITMSQKIEHYEIASYGCLSELAGNMNQEEIAKLMRDSMEEEKRCDEKLTALAESGINEDAYREAA